MLHLRYEKIVTCMTDSILLITTSHTAGQFSLHTVIVSAESVSGSTPGVRVTWSTTAPLECVKSVRVDFRTSRHGSVVATYTTTNTSETEILQTGLQSPSTAARVLSSVYSMKDHSLKHVKAYCPKQAPTGTCNKLGVGTCTEVLPCFGTSTHP